VSRQTSRQVGAIQVYNPKDKDDSSERTWGRCNCCGEDCKSHGMCLSCVQSDCHSDFTEPCSRTGVVDPLDYHSPMYGVE